MKLNKKYIIILIFTVSVIMVYAPICFAIVPDLSEHIKVVSKGVAILLSCMQILQYAIPFFFFISKIIINIKKKNGKNTLKNIFIYLFISIAIFLLIMGIGFLILTNSSFVGFSSSTLDYIHYNGVIVYFHR